jgi:tetratricopeptide (TPR) repeat protein
MIRAIPLPIHPRRANPAMKPFPSEILFTLYLFFLSGFGILFPPWASAEEPLSFSSILTAPEEERKKALLLYIRSHPEDPRGFNTLGALALKEKNYPIAGKLFARASSLNPREPKYRYNYLLSLFYQDRFLEALTGLIELYRTYPEYVRERLHLERARGEVERSYTRTHHPLLGMILKRWSEIKEHYQKGDPWR